MKLKIICLSLFTLLFFNTTFAQKTDSTKNNSNKNEKFKPKNWLYLSNEQQKKQETINKEAKIKIRAINADSTLTREQKKQKIRDINSSQWNSFNSILTSDQKAKMDTALNNSSNKQ